jgi:hypothetical protein
MTKKPSKSNDPEEYKRFLETAKKVEVEESPEAFDRAFKKVSPPRKPQKR